MHVADGMEGRGAAGTARPGLLRPSSLTRCGLFGAAAAGLAAPVRAQTAHQLIAGTDGW